MSSSAAVTLRLLALVAVSALAMFASATSAAPEKTHTGYPSSMASLGDSTTTGYNADSARPPHDELENAWTTGTNPAVSSHYQRILAANPRIKGNTANLAKDGAPPLDLVRQAGLLTQFKPDYVIVGLGYTPDFCHGEDGSSSFSAQWAKALGAVSKASPDARIFVTGIWFGAQSYEAVAEIPEARQIYSDDSLCDPKYDAANRPNPQRVQFVADKLAHYNTLVAAACARFIHCRFDGAITDLVTDAGDFSSDYGHPSVQGIAKVATQTWSATFDFKDTKAPVSKARVTGGKVGLAATDGAGVAGLEYKLNGKSAWVRYRKPVAVKRGHSLQWRAVDRNGNCEPVRTLKR